MALFCATWRSLCINDSPIECSVYQHDSANKKALRKEKSEQCCGAARSGFGWMELRENVYTACGENVGQKCKETWFCITERSPFFLLESVSVAFMGGSCTLYG